VLRKTPEVQECQINGGRGNRELPLLAVGSGKFQLFLCTFAICYSADDSEQSVFFCICIRVGQIVGDVFLKIQETSRPRRAIQLDFCTIVLNW
jgi:hypothetical protein